MFSSLKSNGREAGTVLLAVALAAVGACGLVFGGATAGDERTGGEEKLRIEPTSYQEPRLSLEGGEGWINTAGPIHLEDLRGKVVLLDFWTYCCINCHHVLPDLAYLEEKYKNELVVIGVHTAKFDAEKDTDNIRKKVAEYRIKHPVINDANQVLWTRFGVGGWPTLAVIDANGVYQGQVSGEGHRAALDQYLGKLIDAHKKRGEISEAPVTFFPESEKPHEGGLLYPGKVVADEKGSRLFISDTGHNRIVVTDLSGKAQKIAGDGQEGLADGPLAKARFNRPQGMCLVGEMLYVADTENHAIRAIDLKADQVKTVAGTGHQMRVPQPRGRGAAREVALSSPWDVIPIHDGKMLAIAMAGPHQIWTLDLEKSTVGVYAGTAVENILDGPLDSAQFAQPSGLATDGTHLFVADSEVSGVRSVTLDGKEGGRVSTIVGVHLFGFGDVDGRGSDVRLQHCLGLAYGGGKLYIADTYNNKIKVCDPKTRTVKAFVGTGKPGTEDDPPQFDEPGGLSLLGETLYVADTNNHAIRKVVTSTRKVSTLKLDIQPPHPAPRPPSFPNSVAISAPAAKVEPGKQLTVEVALALPAGFKLNPEAPMPYQVETPGQTSLLAGGSDKAFGKVEKPGSKLSFTVPLAETASDGLSASLKVSLAAFICREGAEGFCTIKSYVWTVPVQFAAAGEDRLSLSTSAPKNPSSAK